MKLITLLLMLTVISYASAQDIFYKVTQSKVFEEEKEKTTLMFAEEDANGDIYVVRNFLRNYGAPKGYYIERYSAKLELLDRTIVDVHRSELQGFFIVEDKLILIEFRYIQEDKKYAFHALKSSKDTLAFTSSEILAIDRDKLKKYDHWGIRKDFEYNFFENYYFGEVVTSENKEFFAINVLMKGKKGNAFNVNVFNSAGEIIYNHIVSEVVDRKTGKAFNKTPLLIYQNMTLGNDGRAFLLGKVFFDGSDKIEKEGRPNYSYELFKLSENRQQQLSLSVGDSFVQGLSLISAKNKLYSVGIYADELSSFFKISGKDGIVTFEVDQTNFNKVNTTFDTFSEQVKEDLSPKNRDAPGKVLSFISGRDRIDKAGVVDFSPKGIMLLKNEEIILELEQKYLYRDDRGGFDAYYGNILLLRIDQNGNLVFDRAIKKQTSTGSWDWVPRQSFTSINNEEGTFVFLNAGKRLEDLKDGRVEFEKTIFNNKDYSYLIYIDNEGNKTYKQALNSFAENTIFEFRFGIQVNENSLIVEGEQDGKPLLFKIETTK